VIYIPPGDYSLKTRVTVDISYLQIKGSGHGFTSLSIRYNSGGTSSWYEINPGASHVKVENTDGNAEAFLVKRTPNNTPRLSSIEFRDFCLDGVSFSPDQNSYANGKIGIRVDSDNDSFRLEGMGFVYLEHAFINLNADALNVTNNFITECGSCIELTSAGQASKVTNNLIGAGYDGFSIFAEGHTGLLISGNNVFPRGASMVHLKNTSLSSITGNRFHAFYPGMINMEGANNQNLISNNHFKREVETYSPFASKSNGKDDLYGLIFISGSSNMVTTNFFTYNVASSAIRPNSSTTPTLILVKSGDGNFLSNNLFVANVATNHVLLDGTTTNTKVLDCGSSTEIYTAYVTSGSFTVRATP
jgi:inulin fructotransferase (DFA-I-forming)